MVFYKKEAHKNSLNYFIFMKCRKGGEVMKSDVGGSTVDDGGGNE